MHSAYTPTDWVAMLDEAGYERIDCYSDWLGEKPPTPEKRLIIRAR